jgi:hypothetical protein
VGASSGSAKCLDGGTEVLRRRGSGALGRTPPRLKFPPIFRSQPLEPGEGQ